MAVFRARPIAIAAFAVLAGACAHPRRRAPLPASPPSPQLQSRAFVATAYCQGKVTSTGAAVGRGIVAADPRVLPLGTVIRIAGARPYDREYRVLDTGPKVRGRHVDVYIADCREARRFGRRTVQVTIVR